MSHQKPILIRVDLDRVKRDAKRLRNNRNISLCEAQNEIAHEFGYQTFEQLRVAVLAARRAPRHSLPLSYDPNMEKIVAWFKERFTHIDDYETRVSPLIAKSLRQYARKHGKSVLRSVDVADEIDYGYDFRMLRMSRAPGALAAENFLVAKGEWVSNAFLDSLRIREGGFWGGGPDDIVGDRLTFEAFVEREEDASTA